MIKLTKKQSSDLGVELHDQVEFPTWEHAKDSMYLLFKTNQDAISIEERKQDNGINLLTVSGKHKIICQLKTHL